MVIVSADLARKTDLIVSQISQSVCKKLHLGCDTNISLFHFPYFLNQVFLAEKKEPPNPWFLDVTYGHSIFKNI